MKMKGRQYMECPFSFYFLRRTFWEQKRNPWGDCIFQSIQVICTVFFIRYISSKSPNENFAMFAAKSPRHDTGPFPIRFLWNFEAKLYIHTHKSSSPAFNLKNWNCFWGFKTHFLPPGVCVCVSVYVCVSVVYVHICSHVYICRQAREERGAYHSQPYCLEPGSLNEPGVGLSGSKPSGICLLGALRLHMHTYNHACFMDLLGIWTWVLMLV